MKIQRTLPPAAAPINIGAVFSGLAGMIKGSDETTRFRTELSEYYNTAHVSLVSSGKAALYVILKALREKYPDRNEVLIPALTCYSVPSVIVKAGFKVRLCDIDSETLDFDYDQLTGIFENSTSDKILAIVSTHLFGPCADVGKLNTFAKSRGVVVIEDAAQAMGSISQGQKSGMIGDIGFFSLSRGKSFSTVEGGIILTQNKEYAAYIENQVNNLPEYGLKDLAVLIAYSVILSFFMHPFLFWIPKSIPFLKLGETIFCMNFYIKKMSSFQAGLSRGWQNKLADFNQARSANSKYWMDFFTFKSQKKVQPVSSGSVDDNREFTGNLNPVISSQCCIRFPVIIEDETLRNNVLEQSEEWGTGVMPTYPDSIDGIDELKNHLGEQSFFPNAKKMTEKLVTLPVHPFVNESDRKKISTLFCRE